MAMTPEEKHERRVGRFEQSLKCLTLGKAKNNVAKEFQKLVRMEEADDNGICTCVICGFRGRWNNDKKSGSQGIDAGHFYSLSLIHI